jgi:hypothetical protein
MRTGSGFVVMYSIVSPASVDDVQLFIDQIKRVKDQDDVPIVSSYSHHLPPSLVVLYFIRDD